MMQQDGYESGAVCIANIGPREHAGMTGKIGRPMWGLNMLSPYMGIRQPYDRGPVRLLRNRVSRLPYGLPANRRSRE